MRAILLCWLSVGCSNASGLRCGPGTHQAGDVCLPDQPDLANAATVFSAVNCLVGGNVVFFMGDGGDWVHPGTTTITSATWTPYLSPGGDTPSDVRLHLEPTDTAEGLWWDLEFSTLQLNMPMAERVYEDAMRAAFTDPGHPGLDIGGDGRGCNTISGRFQIETLQMQSSTLSAFTATWEQHCEAGTSTLYGCVHYEM